MMNNLLHGAVAPSTRRTYSAGTRQFKTFCKEQHLTYLPASELTIRLFCTAQTTRITHATIATYVSATRMLHIENGFADPTEHAPLLATGD